MPWLVIEGIGYATELLEHNILFLRDACFGFQRSMKMALRGYARLMKLSVIVINAPGTIKGDGVRK